MAQNRLQRAQAHVPDEARCSARSTARPTAARSLVGSFCALLELVKLGVIEVDQEERAADIGIRVRPEHREDIEAVVRATGFEDELEAEQGPQGASDTVPEPNSDTSAASEPDGAG